MSYLLEITHLSMCYDFVVTEETANSICEAYGCGKTTTWVIPTVDGKKFLFTPNAETVMNLKPIEEPYHIAKGLLPS